MEVSPDRVREVKRVYTAEGSVTCRARRGRTEGDQSDRGPAAEMSEPLVGPYGSWASPCLRACSPRRPCRCPSPGSTRGPCSPSGRGRSRRRGAWCPGPRPSMSRLRASTCAARARVRAALGPCDTASWSSPTTTIGVCIGRIRARLPSPSRPIPTACIATPTGGSAPTASGGRRAGAPRFVGPGRRRGQRAGRASTVPANRARSPRAATSTPRRASLRTDVGCRGSAGTCRGCRGTGASSGSRTWRPTARSARSVGWPGGTESIWQPSWSPSGDLKSSRATARVVEPRALHRRRTCGAASGPGRVRLSAVGDERDVVRVPGRRPHRVLVRGSRCSISPCSMPRPAS